MVTTDQPATDAPFPRYFVHQLDSDSPGALFICGAWPRTSSVVLPDGTTGSFGSLPLEEALRFVGHGIFDEITAKEAEAMLAAAKVQREGESTGARRSKA